MSTSMLFKHLKELLKKVKYYFKIYDRLHKIMQITTIYKLNNNQQILELI